MIPHLLKLVVGELRCRAFDWQHGVSTCGAVQLEGLTLRGANTQHGFFYYPTHPKLVRDLLASLDIPYRDYTFIDFGSGKGRVLLAASEYPFGRIVGVEFAEELHIQAVDNIRRYRSRSQRCRVVESVHADATEYPIPDTPLVLYFFNPFARPVFTTVLASITASLEANPRDALLVYVNPVQADLIQPPFQLIRTAKYYNLYRAPRDGCNRV
jgi:SAM-dependent methyltransferase